MCCVREHTACDGKLACTMCVSWDGKLACAVCESMRLAAGSWRVQCERACGVRREAGVCDVCEHAACDGKLACAV